MKGFESLPSRVSDFGTNVRAHAVPPVCIPPLTH
jgi:hypothetical protein